MFLKAIFQQTYGNWCCSDKDFGFSTFASNSLLSTDTDVLVIVEDDAPPFRERIEAAAEKGMPFSGPYEILVETSTGDFTFVQRSYWEFGIKVYLCLVEYILECNSDDWLICSQNNWIEYLALYCLEPHLKLKETLHIDWSINLMKLKYNVLKYCHDHLMISRTSFKKGNMLRCRKTIMHCAWIVKFYNSCTKAIITLKFSANRSQTLNVCSPNIAAWTHSWCERGKSLTLRVL